MSSFCKISIGKTPGATHANAMYIIEQRLKQIPDKLGIIAHEFREWRGEIWEKVTGKPYRPGIEDSGGGKGFADSSSSHGGGRKIEPDRVGGWDR